MTFDLWPTDLNINRDHQLIKDHLPTKFEASGAKRSGVISCTRWWTGMTFDLDLWPTDLKINRDHLLTKVYLPTNFKASGAKRFWVISCTRWSKLAWPLTLTFHLLTWKSIGTIYSPRSIYLPSLKLLGQSVLELSVAQGDELAWPLTLTFDLLTWKSLGIIYSPRTIYLPILKLLGAKRSWVISCTRLRDTDIPTYRPTDQPTYRPTDRCKAICPPFFKGGHNQYITSFNWNSVLKSDIILGTRRPNDREYVVNLEENNVKSTTMKAMTLT